MFSGLVLFCDTYVGGAKIHACFTHDYLLKHPLYWRSWIRPGSAPGYLTLISQIIYVIRIQIPGISGNFCTCKECIPGSPPPKREPVIDGTLMHDTISVSYLFSPTFHKIMIAHKKNKKCSSSHKAVRRPAIIVDGA